LLTGHRALDALDAQGFGDVADLERDVIETDRARFP
jgi:hypothetical protein